MDRKSVEGDVRIRVLYINIPGEPPRIGCPLSNVQTYK